ncbi:looped-hinge helix DNA binding domain-containing protein, AbrB family [Microbulbifer donghaiensis]|uniref:Looped-hinge helix DNA binding domain-containing protein, AbrB family n=1 Tax=Microbulbifer donghaiensis TaxID=494016 RepID=A0A1M4XP28_9GAMM|nr:AbrB/MazE/SpoVT family DNA-binding domain-containing protein [Microbulbifer donghaiensis]SHE95347.1 looped-hinge helix DNA binding domain-containing protein, AbrB family [Microbulbifer donghaiensis]
MAVATLSSKFQLGIPKSVREELGLKAGQKFTVIAKGSVIELVPVRSMDDMRGLLRGASTVEVRDRRDRF